MAEITDIQNEIIEEFELFDNWTDKYSYIVELGKKLDPMKEEYKTESNIIKGCQSRVWLQPFLEEDKLRFETDSDAIIVKGLIYLLVRVYSNQKLDDIMSIEPYFIDKIGMAQHLSPTRANGLAAMVKQMKLYAMAFKAKHEASK